MRLIVACAKCCRRFDASGRRPGSRFRCLCGEILDVGSPRGHDAAVVRCSSCGAPRQQGASACGHCSSDFTLHEQDLHTVCPTCLARVSDRARYCHFCATPMHAEHVPDEPSDFRCPVCRPRRKLKSRRLGQFAIAVLECQRCAGLWLGMDSLDQMLASEERARHQVVTDGPPRRANAFANTRPYIPCVTCGELMARRNLARGKSGIVVDLCSRHGVWFDADELAMLIAWTRTGGLDELRLDLARLAHSKDSVRKRQILAEERRPTITKVSSQPILGNTERPFATGADWVVALAKIALEVLGQVIR